MKPRKPIRRVSKKRAAANAIYTKLRKQFLESHPYCQWWLEEHGASEAQAIIHNGIVVDNTMNEWARCPAATEIHHMKKPKCKYLNDTSTWMAVSRAGHDWIEDHKSEARAKGYLFNI